MPRRIEAKLDAVLALHGNVSDTDDERQLPPYLLRTDPMELEDIPLQVALLTMEIAALRTLVHELIDGRRRPDNDD